MMENTADLVAKPELWAAGELPFLPMPEARASLAAYIDLLLAWNEKLNLTGYSDAGAVLADLVQDSFFLARFLEDVFPDYEARLNLEIYDLGAGAGIPGIPLRILWPFGRYTWIERRSKRAIFLRNASARLKLNMRGSTSQARDFLATRKADCIISRAFMPWRDLLGLCAGSLSRDGAVIIMANESPAPMPDGWILGGSLAYSLPRKQRWLWAIRRQPA